MERFQLAGKVALVTGASHGIGEGIARAFAEAGADVALVARTVADLERVAADVRAGGRRALVVSADLSRLDAIPSIVGRVVEELGTVDILANVAGVQRRKPILQVTPEDFDFVLDVQVRAVYFLSQAVTRVMIERDGGKIINIASMTSFRGFKDISLYGLSKAAIVQLTKTMALEWVAHRIYVNAIAPGWIDTPMTVSMNPTRRRWVEEHVPLGKYGQPEDVGPLAVYLASSASDYTTGHTFAVDGGFLAGNPWP
ncbi:MAG: glucose 1-dehydrogenase [Chloroflexi bacterium]|nr:glucose 1-dehydrogenase [Chloroflexota bacterium]